MSKNNCINFWKQFQKTSLVLLLGLTVFLSAAASVSGQEESEITDENVFTEAFSEQHVTDEDLMSIQFTNISLKGALELLAERLNVGFSYSPDIIPDKKVNFSMTNVPAHMIIYKLLEGTNLESVLPPSKDVIILKEKESANIITAQTGTIEGKVTDNQGQSLPGVNIVIDLGDETLGTSTDAEGSFRLTSVPVGTINVTARFLGFRSQTKTVEVVTGEIRTVNFNLTTSTTRLDEVVVTGTGGEVSREKLGTSITSINTNELMENASINSFDEILEGRAAGLRSVQTSGTVGGGNDLRVRGTSSFTLGQRPAVYIDGVRIDTRATEWAGGGARFSQEFSGGQGTDRLSDLSPNEIQNIEIVKGAAAATLYGSDASNGVI